MGLIQNGKEGSTPKFRRNFQLNLLYERPCPASPQPIISLAKRKLLYNIITGKRRIFRRLRCSALASHHHILLSYDASDLRSLGYGDPAS